jgi:hypothetical protein
MVGDKDSFARFFVHVERRRNAIDLTRVVQLVSMGIRDWMRWNEELEARRGGGAPG